MKKKITFIINSLDGGGTENHLLQIVTFLKKKYSIGVFSFSSGRLLSLFNKEKVSVTIPKGNENSIICLIKYLLKNDTDCYHFFLPKSYLIAGFLTFFSVKKKVMSRRSLNYYHKKYFYISLFLEKYLHRKMDVLLTNSNQVREQLIKKEKVPENKVRLIKNLYIEKKKQKIRAKYKFDKKKIVFAIVANLIPYKGHRDLIKACNDILRKDWRLLIIGEDRKNYKRTLEKDVKKFDLQNNIIFTGFLENAESYLNDLDFVVNVSEEEGSSNAILQSLANGLPILAYDIDSNKELVRHNKNGFLVKKGDISELAFFLEKILKSKKNRIKMGKYSKEIFKSEFNYVKAENQYLTIYKELFD